LASRNRRCLRSNRPGYFVRVINREKLACHKCPEDGVVTAAAWGPKIVEKGKLSDAVDRRWLIKKYRTLRTGVEMPIYFEPHTFGQLDMSSSDHQGVGLLKLLFRCSAVGFE